MEQKFCCRESTEKMEKDPGYPSLQWGNEYALICCGWQLPKLHFLLKKILFTTSTGKAQAGSIGFSPGYSRSESPASTADIESLKYQYNIYKRIVSLARQTVKQQENILSTSENK